MELNQFLDEIVKAASRLGDYWQAKVAMAGILAVVQFHAELLALFTLLIIIDLATKWIQLAYTTIKTDNHAPDLLESIKAIPGAHRKGIISSRKMKTQFCGKIIVYVIVVAAGNIMDTMTMHAHGYGLVMPLCISYLAASEVLSIIENLDGAGVSAVHDLVSLIKRKRG